MLSVNHLDVRFGEKHLFKDISQRVHAGDRVGLVGVNGAGKSTLLKIMAGVSACDDGVITKSKHFSVGYLPQESSALVSDNTLYQEAESAFDEILTLQQEAEFLHDQLAEMTDHNSELFNAMIERQGELQHQLEGHDVYTIRARVEKVLLGLGFKQTDMDAPVTSFSGGWVMRLMLAKMLLVSPSLLLLDEPTNHLDLESLTWVEDFFRSCQGAMVIISHDRTFLDKITKTTWELSMGRLSVYKGNYSYYIKEKAERRIIEKGAYDNQQAKIKQTMRFVERFRAKSTKAKQVQSRVKQLDKIDMIELSDDEQQIRFTFPPAPPSGRDVLQIEGLSKSYQGRQIFSDVNLQLQRGDKVAVVGVNGAGKSTLVKIIGGQLEYDAGEIKLGHNVQLSYFGQHQAQELSPTLSALETMALSGADLTITRVRSLLGAFLFRGEEVDKKVAVLSGGEKSRLALAKMIAKPANLMLLDEPTNHLDISSQEVLQEAMAQYDGCIVVVSHNRYFLDSFINKVLLVKDGQVALYEGNVTEYLRKAALEDEEKKSPVLETIVSADASGVEHSRESKKEKRQQEAQERKERGRKLAPWKKKEEEAEKQVASLEVRKEELEALMANPDLYSDEEAWARTSKEYDQCKSHLERWYSQWEEAQEEIEAIEAD
ncbi:MAG: ABC-F family ATP-binding cassette domain-containing protein [Proteobacteria bacterium]|nr:ABC-F family ATP-binding cassette domain-containing protein [Desulfocapsa sp.]MBU3943477.1 ABC-F family ATP-binding cassette domain-containing protein [Pseudomonadota bacterium]MBU4029297.1 ABC-F family ATP-binding cassette domain-containing protein [Pseudomonadota bacterium]MBU4041530.1 ABC-F family ATP-binding cassette domain-containing protein [Pseudomonadota bacterium]MBU4085149.1 ABC-F family ATP-binding cassette domain-containing protein [Pseudomonadota bacterium]